jgi:hypothetical protein
MAVKIQLRRGTTSDWSSANPVLSAGEVGVNTTTTQIKVGDGTSTWNSLSYFASGTITSIVPGTGIKLNSASSTITGGAATVAIDTAVVMQRSIVSGLGQVVVGGGASSPVALPAGTNNYVLVADSTNTTYGVKWAPVDTNLVTSATFGNADIATDAGIVDSKLATITTTGKVSNSATTATHLNTLPSTIVSRNASGNFAAGTITASLAGNADTATLAATVTTIPELSGAVTSTGSTNVTTLAANVVSSDNIINNTIVNADIALDAAIKVSKLDGVQLSQSGNNNSTFFYTYTPTNQGSNGDIWFKYIA